MGIEKDDTAAPRIVDPDFESVEELLPDCISGAPLCRSNLDATLRVAFGSALAANVVFIRWLAEQVVGLASGQ